MLCIKKMIQVNHGLAHLAGRCCIQCHKPGMVLNRKAHCRRFILAPHLVLRIDITIQGVWWGLIFG